MPTATPKKRERIKEEVIQIRTTKELKAKIEALAKRDGISRTAFVTQLLMRAVEERQ